MYGGTQWGLVVEWVLHPQVAQGLRLGVAPYTVAMVNAYNDDDHIRYRRRCCI
jgi:hypothetical protein